MLLTHTIVAFSLVTVNTGTPAIIPVIILTSKQGGFSIRQCIKNI